MLPAEAKPFGRNAPASTEFVIAELVQPRQAALPTRSAPERRAMWMSRPRSEMCFSIR